MIETFASMVPQALNAESGKVFYSGRQAFLSNAPLYIVGVNPGGDPDKYRSETVGDHTRKVLSEYPDSWSAYRDESWEGAAPGTLGMAPRILHFLKKMELCPENVPASNLVFVRSRREAHLGNHLPALLDLCWPFHAHVIETIRPRVILCLGSTAGKYVCRKLEAYRQAAEFVEKNNRRWASRLYISGQNHRVVIATHPSIADWTAPATDPSPLVLRAML